MYRPAASDLPGQSVATGAGETAEIVEVLRAVRAGGSSISPAADSGRLEAADRRLGAGPVAWAVEAAHDARAVGISGVAAASGPMLRCFYESLLLDALILLAGGVLAADEPARLGDLARVVERRGGGHADLIAHLRSVQRFWTGLLLDHAAGRGAGSSVLREVTVVVGACFDRLVDDAVTSRSAGRPEGHEPRSDDEQGLVESLVAGTVHDPACLTELGVDLGCAHVALVLTRLTAASGPDADLDAAARSVGRALGGCPALRHRAADGALWVWLVGTRVSTSAPVDLGGVGVGVGSSRIGLAGLRRSHLEARDAHRFAAGPRGPVVHYEDVAFAALLGRDPERARWFVAAQLGPLAGDDEASGELRRTLCAYYGSGMRLASTATSLDLHRNTLVNRLRRIEKLLGREVVERVAETHSALLMIDGAGSPIIR